MTLSIKPVRKQHWRDFWGLRGFSLEINAGLLGLLGSNGDGIGFDFGIDICKCAIQKHYRAQNTDEFTLYVCHLDHAVGKMLELGFYRQNTFANGAAVCDCSWKLGTAAPGQPPSSITVLQDSYLRLGVST